MNRREVESHLQSATRLHLDLACNKLNNTQIQLNKTQDELRSSIETTRKLEQKFSGLEMRIDRNLNEKFSRLERRVDTVEQPRPFHFDSVEGKVTLLQTTLTQLDKRVKDIEEKNQSDTLATTGSTVSSLRNFRTIRKIETERFSNTLSPTPPTPSRHQIAYAPRLRHPMGNYLPDPMDINWTWHLSFSNEIIFNQKNSILDIFKNKQGIPSFEG